MISAFGTSRPDRVAVLSLALIFGAGVLMAQGLAPHNWIWASVVALVFLGDRALRCVTAKQAALTGWLFGFGYFVNGLQWVVEPFQVDAQAHAWMAPFALLLLAAGLALFWGAALGLAQRFAHGSWRVLALIGWWALMEFLRAYALTGFPWAGLAQLSAGATAMSLLPFVGPHGLGLLWLIVTLPVALFWHAKRLAGAIVAGGLCLVLFGVASGPMWTRAPAADDVALTPHMVRLVQPNAPQNEKWDPDKRWDFVRRQVAFSAETPRPDLIVWPETSVPQLLEHAAETFEVIAESANNVPVFLGIQRRDASGYYNSAVLLDAQGQVAQVYDKAHLVPFGEYVPFGERLAKLGIHGLASQNGAGYVPGRHAMVVESPVGRMLPLICYEAVFPQDIYQVAERPAVLTQITNDAWFGTRSGPQQHLVQARMRAAEQGLPMIRVANTGISGMIDPYGRLRENLPLGVSGYVDAALPAALPATLYSRTGDWPAFIIALLFTCLAAAASKYLRQRHIGLMFSW